MFCGDSHKRYYGLPELWSSNFFDRPAEKARVAEIVLSVPEDAKSVLEVGCGNGAVINVLSKERPDITRLTGIDISDTALEYVTTEKYQCNAGNLMFSDKSFDGIVASEVIEHLTYDDLGRSVDEIKRVANKWILVSVPNDEDLESASRMCVKCSCWFNPNYHMNSFNKNNLASLFHGFDLEWIREIGPYIRHIKYSVIGGLIFHYNMRHPPTSGICPQCGFNHTRHLKQIKDGMGGENRNTNILYRKIGVLANIATRILFTREEMKRRWLLAMYKRS